MSNKYEYLYKKFDNDQLGFLTCRPSKYFYFVGETVDIDPAGLLDELVDEAQKVARSMKLYGPAEFRIGMEEIVICGWKQMEPGMAKRLDMAIARHDANVLKQKELAKQKALKKKEKERQMYEKLKVKFGE